MQGDAPFRMNPEDLNALVRAQRDGRHGAVLRRSRRGTWTYGSPKLERYNGVSSVEIQGAGGAGQSHGPGDGGDASARGEAAGGHRLRMDRPVVCRNSQSGSQAPILYGISILVVFLCLAALYESWSIPFSVIMVVPLGVLGALLAATVRGLENDVYFQVGLLTTIGLVGEERDPDRRVRPRTAQPRA